MKYKEFISQKTEGRWISVVLLNVKQVWDFLSFVLFVRKVLMSSKNSFSKKQTEARFPSNCESSDKTTEVLTVYCVFLHVLCCCVYTVVCVFNCSRCNPTIHKIFQCQGTNSIALDVFGRCCYTSTHAFKWLLVLSLCRFWCAWVWSVIQPCFSCKHISALNPFSVKGASHFYIEDAVRTHTRFSQLTRGMCW